MCDIDFIKICEKLDKIISTVGYVENPTNDLQMGPQYPLGQLTFKTCNEFHNM